MTWYCNQGAEDKVTVLIRYLVHSFPLASILSRQVEARYHLFVIVPFDGTPEKTLQVEIAMFRDQRLAVEGFAARLSALNLHRIFDRIDRYELPSFLPPAQAPPVPTFTAVSQPRPLRMPTTFM